MVQITKQIKCFEVDRTWIAEIYEGTTFHDGHMPTSDMWKSYGIKFSSDTGGSIRFTDTNDQTCIIQFKLKSDMVVIDNYLVYEDTKII